MKDIEIGFSRWLENLIARYQITESDEHILRTQANVLINTIRHLKNTDRLKEETEPLLIS